MSAVFSTDTRFVLESDIRYRRVGDEAVVVRQEVNQIMVLNGVGAQLLDLVSSGKSVGEMTNQILDEYEVTTEDLDRDIPAYLQELLDNGVICTLADTPDEP